MSTTYAPMRFSWRKLSSNVRPSPADWLAFPEKIKPAKNAVSQAMANDWLGVPKDDLQHLIKTATLVMNNLRQTLARDDCEVLAITDRRFCKGEMILLCIKGSVIDQEEEDEPMIDEEEEEDGAQSVAEGIPSRRALRKDDVDLSHPFGCINPDRAAFISQIVVPRVLRVLACELMDSGTRGNLWTSFTDLSLTYKPAGGDERLRVIRAYFLYHLVKKGATRSTRFPSSPYWPPSTTIPRTLSRLPPSTGHLHSLDRPSTLPRLPPSTGAPPTLSRLPPAPLE